MRSTRLPLLPGLGDRLLTAGVIVRRLCLGMGLGLALGSCSNDTTPVVYIDLAYQLRCLDCEPRAPDDAGHIIKNVNGEDGYKVECTVSEVDGTRRVNFSAEYTDPMHSASNHSFKIASGNIDADESDLKCELDIVEGANSYSGACSSDEPNPEAGGGPCQATFKVEDGVVTGGVHCTAIPNAANLESTRYVVSPNTRTDAAKFKVYGCAGL